MNDAKCDRYIENLRKVRAFAKPEVRPGMGAQELLDLIQKNAAESFAIMKENNALLDELVYTRKAEELTDEDIAQLLRFADRLFAYANSEDDGVAYKIHCLLLEAARLRKDEPFLIRELYYCGVTLHYLNIRDEEYDINAFGNRVRAYFEEGASYLNRYESYDSKTRGFIIRCLGNSKMALNRRSKENSRIYMNVFDRAMAIMTDPYYQQLNPEIPWKSFIYTMQIDQLSMLPHLRDTNDLEIARKVYESAEYVDQWVKENQGEEERLQNWRVNYFYWGARYHAGLCTIRQAVEKMLESVEQVDPNDFSASGINNNLGLTSHMYPYVALLRPEDEKALHDRLERTQERCMEYVARMPVNRYPRLSNIAIWDLAEAQAYLKDRSHGGTIQYLLAAHKPTYVHSLMVARLTRHLISRLLEKCPEQLIGLRGYHTTEELKRHAVDLCELAYECGLYHDVGKNSITMYISNNARRLLDEEFACIRLHPEFGYGLLQQSGREDLAQAALYHHRFYNGKGGYPEGHGSCRPEMKAILDVLNVTDSLDAATDNVGRCYNAAKPVEVLVEEFRREKGTRYAPYVVELFDDPEFCRSLADTLTETRKQVYLEVYNTPDDRPGEE